MQPQHKFDSPLFSLELNIVKDMEWKGVFFGDKLQQYFLDWNRLNNFINVHKHAHDVYLKYIQGFILSDNLFFAQSSYIVKKL